MSFRAPVPYVPTCLNSSRFFSASILSTEVIYHNCACKYGDKSCFELVISSITLSSSLAMVGHKLCRSRGFFGILENQFLLKTSPIPFLLPSSEGPLFYPLRYVNLHPSTYPTPDDVDLLPESKLKGHAE